MSTIDRDKTVIFDDKTLADSLNTIIRIAIDMGINKYPDNEEQLHVLRNELKRSLTYLLLRIIDGHMEHWTEEEEFSEEELNRGID